MPDDNNSWNKYQKLVLHELERLTKCYEVTNERLTEIEKDIVMLKVKSGLWGATAGAVTVLLYVLYNFLKV